MQIAMVECAGRIRLAEDLKRCDASRNATRRNLTEFMTGKSAERTARRYLMEPTGYHESGVEISVSMQMNQLAAECVEIT